MKKRFIFFCIFYITFFVYTIHYCNAQVEMKLDSLEMETVDSNDSLFFQVDTLIVLTENEYLETENVKIAKLKKHPPLDSVQLKKHSPKKASWLAIIPGAGQIYNKKYWKLPIVYGGLGATGFLIYYYADKTSIFRKEYVARVNGKTDNRNPKLSEYSDDNILELRNFYRRNMEICVAVCTVVYFLSILDACVDAHLYYYDISENLAIAVKPKIDYYPINGSTTAGMGLVLKF